MNAKIRWPPFIDETLVVNIQESHFGGAAKLYTFLEEK